MKRTITIITAIFAIAFGAAEAAATDFTFNVTSGDWETAGHWAPTGTPGANDTATIPNGKTCRVEQDQSADSIDIEAGGTIRVIATVGDPLNLAIFADSTINGTLELEGVSSKVAGLLIAGSDPITLNGTGTIRGITQSVGLAAIFYQSLCDDASCTLTIPDLTITGTVAVFTNLLFGGTVLVDDADDTIQLGHPSCAQASISLAGGTYEVDDGQLILECVESITTPNGPPTWTMTGGTLWVTVDCSGCANAAGDIAISGGTLVVDAVLCTVGTFVFNDCTIDVDSGVTATFGGSCP